MSLPHPHLNSPDRRQAAHSTLADLMSTLGGAGLSAAAAIPGLLAEVDQHGAAVLDTLCQGGSALGPVALAGYASGLQDGATEQGWRAPAPEYLDWSRADWASVRIIAICAIARSAGYA